MKAAHAEVQYKISECDSLFSTFVHEPLKHTSGELIEMFKLGLDLTLHLTAARNLKARQVCSFLEAVASYRTCRALQANGKNLCASITTSDASQKEIYILLIVRIVSVVALPHFE